MFLISELVKHVCLLLWITGNSKIFSEACIKGPFRRTITILHYEEPCNEELQENHEKGPPRKKENITTFDPKIYTDSPAITKSTTISKHTEGKTPKPSIDDKFVNISTTEQLGPPSKKENITTLYPKIYTDSPAITKPTTISKPTEGKTPKASLVDKFVNISTTEQLGPPSKKENITTFDPKIYTDSPAITKPTTISKPTEGKTPKPSLDDKFVNISTTEQLDCNKNIILQNLSTSNWQTSNYPQPYPDGIHCKLSIGYPNSQPKGIAILSIDVPSMIFTTDDVTCPGDRLTIERLPDGHVDTLCGNLSGKTIILDMSLLRTITFSSTPNDGGSDIGFSLNIKGLLLG